MSGKVLKHSDARGVLGREQAGGQSLRPSSSAVGTPCESDTVTSPDVRVNMAFYITREDRNKEGTEHEIQTSRMRGAGRRGLGERHCRRRTTSQAARDGPGARCNISCRLCAHSLSLIRILLFMIKTAFFKKEDVGKALRDFFL